MGYCMHQLDWHVKIASADKAGALAALKAMDNSNGNGRWDDGQGYGPQWSWVSQRDVNEADTLEEALDAWRWHATTGKNGDIHSLEFVCEKYGDDPVMFKVLAPFVEDGSFIEMQGEDGERWMWKFGGGKVETFQGQTVYE